jgi:hypothetical protein
MPAASIPTTSRIFDRLKMAPLISAGMANPKSIECMFALVLMPASPNMPKV